MRVLVIGAHGQIGRQAVSQLAASGHQARAMIRDEAQRPELENSGGEVVVADLEQDFESVLEGCDAVIFSAGSGGHTGPDKTELVDRLGAMRAIDHAKQKGIGRFLIVSSMNADTPDNGPEFMKHYFKAKGDADHHLQESGLNYTIVRPGTLSNDAGNGRVDASETIKERGDRNVPREDVARVLVAALDIGNTYRRTFELLSGHTPIEQALRDL